MRSESYLKKYQVSNRSDIVYLQNTVVFERAGCHGYDEQYD